MSASCYRHRIIIEKRTNAPDGQGGSAPTWSTFRDTRGAVKPVSARQLAFSASLQHRVTHSICTRFFAGLKSDMRIRFDGRIFQVQSFRDIHERKREYEIMCEEGKPS